MHHSGHMQSRGVEDIVHN